MFSSRNAKKCDNSMHEEPIVHEKKTIDKHLKDVKKEVRRKGVCQYIH